MPNVTRAVGEGHADVELLRRLAEVIAGHAAEEALDEFET
jgi:hypothetical protein